MNILNLKSPVEFLLYFLNNKIQSIFKSFVYLYFIVYFTSFVSVIKLLIIYIVVFAYPVVIFFLKDATVCARSQVDELIDYSYVTSISFSLFKLQVYGFYCWFHVRVTVHCVLCGTCHITRQGILSRSVQ